MTTDISVQLVVGYRDSDSTRAYSFNDVPQEHLSQVKQKVKALNFQLADIDDPFHSFFLDDEGNPSDKIVEAHIITTRIDKIYDGGEDL